MNEVVIASHRRSGTHYLTTMLERNIEDAVWGKSHEFPEAHSNALTVYVHRNPFDTLWSLWRWWKNGDSSNRVVQEKLTGMSFKEFVSGDCGPLIGYGQHRHMNRDQLTCTRGMFYDPVAYLFDHNRSWFREVDCPRVAYEHLVIDPQAAVQKVARAYRLKATPRFTIVSEGVGHSPQNQRLPLGDSMKYFDSDMIANVATQGRDILSRMGYSLTERGLEYLIDN